MLLLMLAAALVVVPLARADGDPASDYLLTRSTFVPPDLGISTADAARLSATVAAARSRGYPIHVALIGSAYDLGSVVSLDRKPKQYARFLGTELTLVYHGRLLVVMPNGFGVSRAGKPLPAAQRVVDRLAAPGTGGPAARPGRHRRCSGTRGGVRRARSAAAARVTEQQRHEHGPVGARRRWRRCAPAPGWGGVLRRPPSPGRVTPSRPVVK